MEPECPISEKEPKRRRRAPARPASGVCGKPLAEGIYDRDASLAAQSILAIIKGHGSKAELDLAFARYRETLMKVAERYPDEDLWQVERRSLPDSIRNQAVRVPGLPKSLVPVSFLGWQNPELESALNRLAPQNGRQSGYVRLIARMLDRYVQSFFPIDQVDGFYSSAVIRLHTIYGQAGLYEEAVVALARPLAENAVATLPDTETNPLKMPVHKSIHTETGVHLSEQNPSTRYSFLGNAQISYGRKCIRPTVCGSLGLLPGSVSIPPLLGARLGLPGFEGVIRSNNTREIATRDELLEGISTIIRPGRPETFSHPLLPGMEFQKSGLDQAVLIAVVAQRKLAGDDSAFSVLGPEEVRPAKSLCALAEFGDACGVKDRKKQMGLVLEACAVEARASELSERFGIADSYAQAAKDIETARQYVEEYASPPSEPSMVLRGVREMRALAREADFLDASPFELALSVLDQRHIKKEPVATLKPPEGVPPVSGPLIPKPGMLPADLMGEAGAETGAEGAAAEPLQEPASEQAQEAGLQSPEALEAALEYAAEPAAEPQVPPEQEPAALAQPPAAQAPQAGELPSFNFPFPNSVFDNHLEPLLPPKTDKRNALIRKVARALVSYKTYGYEDVDIDQRCLEAVQLLRTGYSQAAVLDYATSIVDGLPLRKVAPTLIDAPETGAAPARGVAPTLIDASLGAAPADGGPVVAAQAYEEQEVEVLVSSAPEASLDAAVDAALIASQAFPQLEPYEKELVAAVMNEQSCEEATLSDFIAMDPARREMRVEAFIASRWTDGDFRVDISSFRRAKGALYSICNLSSPSGAEKLAEISDPANLLDSQRSIIARLFQASEITPKHIEAFSVWVSSDPSTDEGRAKLGDYWNRELVVGAPGGFNIASGLWLNPSREDRLRFWHMDARDAITAGLLAHRLRFGNNPELSMEDAGMVSYLYGKSAAESSSLSQQSRDNLAMALTQHVYSKQNLYYPEVLAAAKPSVAEGLALVRKAARAEAEYNAMLDFLGVQVEGASGVLIHTHGISRAKRPGGVEKPNEDSWTSAVVTLHDGADISLDMVADGMGGHNKGSNGGKTNGQAASQTAKEIFEVAAVAGWIREPEDVRKIILIADQAIVADQIRKKALVQAHAAVAKRWRDSGVDVANMHPEWVPEFETQVAMEIPSVLQNIDSVQTNDMGTTMVVAFQRGKDLWFIHCGDSDGKLIRDGKVVFATEGHSFEYYMRLEMKEAALTAVSEEYLTRAIDISALDEQGRKEFDGKVEAEYQAKAGAMADFFKQNGNVVSSVLGVKPAYVHINNKVTGFSPIETGDFDIIEVCSDGKSVPVCDHETPIVAFRKSMGDLELARAELVELAASRTGKGLSPTICDCIERKGKVDDITLIMRYAEEGILAHRREYFSGGDFAWLTRRMNGNPSELALSKSLRFIIEGAADPSTGKDSVLGMFDAIIKNAERSSPASSRESYAFALALISTITSMRKDRDELVEALVPALGSWSGLMLKKLRECPDSSARRRVMFDIAAKSVPAGELQPLLRAKNPQVASWAGDAVGLAPETSAPAQAPPRSIFNSQTDISGAPLDQWSTRYLDMSVLEIHGSSVVQDTAKKLGVLPRDLEVMAFYAYSDYVPEASLNPHESGGGDNLIASVGAHLCTGDAERILTASMLLWRFREWPPSTPAEARRLAKGLWDAVESMDKDSPYAQMFFSKAYQYRNLLP